MAKILLVEDDNNLREIYEARLQAEGYDIVAAQDGEAALVVAKQEAPDLIISDVMMPRISGFEMLDILRNTQGMRDVKVIMLTALGQAEDKTRADKLGADRYLVKSQVTLEDIVRAASELLGSNAAAGDTSTPLSAAGDPGAAAVAAPTAAVPIAAEPAVAVSAPEPVAVVAEPVASAPEPTASAGDPATTSAPEPVAAPNSDPVTPITPAVDPQPTPPAPAMPFSPPSGPIAAPDPVPAPAPIVEPTPSPVAAPQPAAPAPEPETVAAPFTPEPQPVEPAPAPVEPAPTVQVPASEPPTAPPEVTLAPVETATPPEQNVQAGPTPAPVASAESVPSTDSELMMADAVKDLLDGSASADQPAATPTTDTPAVETPAPASAAPTNTVNQTPAPTPAESSDTADDSDAVTRKKVIQPLTPDADQPVQPDLNELLAKEGITDFDKESHADPAATYAQAAGTPQTPPVANQPHPPGHVISPNPAQPTDSQGQPVDPNSISL